MSDSNNFDLSSLSFGSTGDYSQLLQNLTEQLSSAQNSSEPQEQSQVQSQPREQPQSQALHPSSSEGNNTAGLPSTITLETDITFEQCAAMFNKYSHAKGEHCDEVIMGPFECSMGVMQGQRFLTVSIQHYAPYSANKYTLCNKAFQIGEYHGKCKIGELPVQPVLDFEYEAGQLITRGTQFIEVTKKPTYLHAYGFMYVPVWGGRMKRYVLDGRVVVDPEGYQKYSDADRWYNREVLDHVPDDMVSCTLPTVPVYSLDYRLWGEVPISHLGEITFDETAFNRTVLPENYRENISVLVKNFYNTKCTDFIGGKKRGLVCLLNGPPGTGKTLTAQGIAELTHRPLFCIGSGDLGTKPDKIDKSLSQIFSMVQNWGGIVLIDEADVFMSTRTDYDVEYNACVSVFLRLVETYFGILFLTTNRDHNIDPAFDSRIHIRAHYDKLDQKGRALVWKESLERYNINDMDYAKLAESDLNNREITNVIQLAYIKAGGIPSEVNLEVISDFIEMRQKFTSMAKTSSSAKATSIANATQSTIQLD